MLERLFRKSNLGIRAFRFKKGYALCYFSYDGSGPEGLLGTAQSDFNYTCSLFRQKASAKDGYDVVLTQAEDSYVIVVTTSYGEPRIAPLMDMLWHHNNPENIHASENEMMYEAKLEEFFEEQGARVLADQHFGPGAK